RRARSARAPRCEMELTAAADAVGDGSFGDDQRPHARIVTAGSGRYRRQGVGVDVGRPQAAERDEVAVLPVHAGDAVVLVPARAIGGGQLLRHGLVLARPRDDAAGVVAVIDIGLGAGGSAQQQKPDHGQQRRAHHPRLPICPRRTLDGAWAAAKPPRRRNLKAWPQRHSRRFLLVCARLYLDFAGVGEPPSAQAIVAGSPIMTGRALLLAFGFAAALAALPAAPAGAANWLEMNFYLSGPEYEGKLPPRGYRAALVKVAAGLNEKENMYWATDLRIVNFEKIRETAFRPWAAQTVPRRFCSGIVEISDGRRHIIHYSIAKDSGMIGAIWGVEWC